MSGRFNPPLPTQSLHVEGNRGGSYITLTETSIGMVRLEVGETCVITVNQEISVAGLAAVLTYCKDRGFQQIIDEYLARGGGQPAISVEHDL